MEKNKNVEDEFDGPHRKECPKCGTGMTLMTDNGLTDGPNGHTQRYGTFVTYWWCPKCKNEITIGR